MSDRLFPQEGESWLHVRPSVPPGVNLGYISDRLFPQEGEFGYISDPLFPQEGEPWIHIRPPVPPGG